MRVSFWRNSFVEVGKGGVSTEWWGGGWRWLIRQLQMAGLHINARISPSTYLDRQLIFFSRGVQKQHCLTKWTSSQFSASHLDTYHTTFCSLMWTLTTTPPRKSYPSCRLSSAYSKETPRLMDARGDWIY